MCQEHPHHCLPVIIAQAHAHADDELVRIGSKSKKQENQVVEEDRVQAAKMLVHRLSTSAIADNIIEFQKVSLAYISLAAWCDKGTKCPAGNKVKIPSNQILVKLQNLKYTAALTRPLQLQPSTIYTPSLIVGWENICTFVGGINAPKRLTLRTSDGLKQYELLKGNDDIRQDAVMEQVFGIVNELLAKNSETRERALSMRTYQVVPLSQKSGLIQWCDNTQDIVDGLGVMGVEGPLRQCCEATLSVLRSSGEVLVTVVEVLLMTLAPVDSVTPASGSSSGQR
ncbi:serine-protein kinase ATM-like [Homarus americanus]|uniref:Serine-protein kinase ATM-like n=1 Tax=Homarus americanus TaxID=6706 RepID=A0A8J5JHL5_HOMAM|nr:serine-protein kinase ATM-like [Homarus americanus]